jgi:hypothetical protein
MIREIELKTGNRVVVDKDAEIERLIIALHFAVGALCVHVAEDNLALRHLEDELEKCNR